MIITVLCTPAGPPADALLHGGPAGPYHFAAYVTEASLRLHLTPRELPAPYVLRETPSGPEVVITTHLAADFARYAGLDLAAYLRTAALAGLVRARSLQQNPDLRNHDLRHMCHPRCVMSQRLLMEEWLPVFEAPMICRACRVFYGHLLTPDELAPLEAHLAALAKRRTALT